MKPAFLVPEITVHEQGSGEAVPCDSSQLLVTLGILHVEEQESLHVSLWQSADGKDWGAKPLTQFPQKFYQGTYQIVMTPVSGWLQARWHVNRWGRGDLTPRFRFYVFLEPVTV